MQTNTRSGALIGLLAALGMLGQFGSNVFLPGLPLIAQDFQNSASAVSASYSVFLAVFGAAQLAAGPMADRYGRKPLALHSTLLFVLASVACAMAPSLSWLLVARVVQAIGAAGAIVVARTVARDCYSGSELVKVLTLIMMAFALVPGLAPLLGGFMTTWSGWRATLWSCAVLGALIWIWTHFQLKETLAPGSNSRQGVLAAYLGVLQNRIFLQMVLVAGIAFGGLLAFFGAAPRLYMLTLGVSPVEFGLYPPIALLGFFVGAAYLRKRSETRTPRALLRIGASLQVLACLIMLVPLALGWLNKWPVSVGIVLFVAGLGVLSPLASASAMNAQTSHVGQASALMGFMQMLAGATGAAIGNILCDLMPALGMQLAMLLLAVVNWLLVRKAPPEVDVLSGSSSKT